MLVGVGGWSVECSGVWLPFPPAFAEADDDKRNDGANDEESHDRHDSIQVTPPSRALVPRLVDDVGLVAELGLRSAELALAAVSVLEHVELGGCWEGKQCGNHPGWARLAWFGMLRRDRLTKRKDEADDK